MITNVFIDIDDTLLDFNESAKEAIRIVMADKELVYTPEVFDTFLRINNALWQKIELGQLTKQELFAVRWNTIFKELGIGYDGPEFETCFRNKLSSCAVPVPYAKEALEYLSGKYTVYAASNAMFRQQMKRLKIAGMTEYFDKFFFSEELGFFKPSKGFFDACFAELSGVQPGEVMMIGDSVSADINGGAEYGLKTCWLNRRGQSTGGVKADYIISSLSEIKEIL